MTSVINLSAYRLWLWLAREESSGASGGTNHVKSKEGIELDEPVEISKDNGDGNKDDVAGVSQQKSHELDKLGEGEHEDELGPEGVESVAKIPLARRQPARGKQKRVDDKGKGGEGSEVEGVGAPGLLSMLQVIFR
jgi:hypothetical protein